MCLVRKKYHLYVVFFCLFLSSKLSFALEFHPGVGVAAQSTDNAALTPDDEISDIITIGYVGANLAENEGSLVYDTTASLRRESYMNDTFDDRRYFNLLANANWEMIRDRFDWYLTDEFATTPVRTTSAETPDNRQDSNAFILGANIKHAITGLQTFSLVPQYSQYYYEISRTNNRQYSLAANWNYQVFRLTNVGLNFSTRKIKYDDRSFADTTFTYFNFIVSGQRVHSNYTINLGATHVKRDAAEGPTVTVESTKSTGFTGSVNWQAELSSRSTMEALVLSEITDTSSVSQSASPGNPDDVQLSTDVIRNSITRLTYVRNDAALHTRIWGEYRKLKYSTSPLDRVVRTFGSQLDFPVTQLVSSGVYINFDNTELLDTFRNDKRLRVGANIKASFSSNLNSTFDVQFRTKESTDSQQNYDEFSFFVSLNYGFGDTSRQSLTGARQSFVGGGY
jgi:hypothetical protein